MPYYPSLKKNLEVNGDKLNKTERKRTAENIISLRSQLKRDLPQKDIGKHLLLATWNIRDLGKSGPKHGSRNLEDLYYIAEIISAFDLLAIQEVNDLEEWELIMDILGREWDYIATDIASYADGGNGERMTFVYDKRKVWFKNIAGEVVLSRTDLISKSVVKEEKSGKKVTGGRQFARTPFLVSFQAGWFNFDLCTVHIYFGAESGIKLKRRIEEIKVIAEELSERAALLLKKYHTMIVLGDFNIVHPKHETMESLTDAGFIIPAPLDRPSNLKNDKYYDQIALKTRNKKIIKFINDDNSVNGGVFEMFESIFRDEDFRSYKTRMKQTTKGKKLDTEEKFKKYFSKEWKTYHLSDHKPMWIRIPIDESDSYLNNIVKRG